MATRRVQTKTGYQLVNDPQGKIEPIVLPEGGWFKVGEPRPPEKVSLAKARAANYIIQGSQTGRFCSDKACRCMVHGPERQLLDAVSPEEGI